MGKAFIYNIDVNFLRCSIFCENLSVANASEQHGISLKKFEAIIKIVDYARELGANRFKSGAYTLVFEHFVSV